MEKRKLLELDLDIDKLIRSAAKAKQTILNLTEAQKKLKAESKEGTDQFVENELAIKRNTKEYRNILKALEDTGDGLDDFNKMQAKANDLIEKQTVSIVGARESNKDLLKIRNELNLKTERGKTLQEEINKKIDENNAFIKENASALEKQKIGVGNYEQAVTSALNKVDFFGISLGDVSDKLFTARKNLKEKKDTLAIDTKATEANATAQTFFSRAVARGNKALKLFKIALASTGVGLLIIGLASLVSFFGTTQKGINKVNKVLIPLKVLLESLLGVFQTLGEKIVAAFSSPEEAIKNLWESIKTNIVNRIEGVGEVFRALSDIITSGFTIGYKELANATLKVTTGVEDVIGKVKEATAEVVAFTNEALTRGKEIAELQERYSASEASFIRNSAKLKQEFEAQNKLAEDQTKTIKEREEAAIKSIQIQKDLNKLEDQRLGLEIAILSKKQQSNDVTDSERAELASLEAARSDSKARQLEEETQQQNKLNSIRKEGVNIAIEIAQFELNEYIRNNKTRLDESVFLNEELFKAEVVRLDLIAEKEREFEAERLRRGVASQEQYNEALREIDEAYTLEKDELNQQREDAQQEKENIDFENELTILALRGESRFKLAIQELDRIRAAEIQSAEATGADTTIIEEKYTELKKGVTRDEFNAKLDGAQVVLAGLSDLLGKETLAGKAAAIAKAAIDTYKAANLALSTYPPPFGQIAAGVSIAAGLVNVKKIASTKTEIPETSAGEVKKVRKFKKGGIFSRDWWIEGGRDHSQGGNKYYDRWGNLVAETSKDEAMGVLNKNATEAFMIFNNKYNLGQIAKPNHFASGGIIKPTQSTTTVVQNPIDYDLLAQKVSEANRSLPSPVVAVEDIRTGVDNQVSVEQGANL